MKILHYKSKIYKYTLPLLLLLSAMLMGWGQNGHKLINSKSVATFPQSMSQFSLWTDSLGNHASDADYRKGSDPSEGPKHYIDIDNYPEFVQNGYISQSYDSAVALHGLSFVMDQGILPWTILIVMDSITAAFARNDIHRAMLLSADLGHYVGDGHNPLHITRNYNGQFTGQTGVHSRYETNMINRYLNEIVYSNETAVYIDNVSEYTFNMLYDNYQYLDSVLYADSVAKAMTGSTSSTSYYQNFWNISKGFTIGLLKKASFRLGCLIYTAWVNSQTTGLNETGTGISRPHEFFVHGNYPNPFNGSSILRVTAAFPQTITINLYDPSGKKIIELGDFKLETGENSIPLLTKDLQLSTGVYLVKSSGLFSSSVNKVVYLK